MMVPLRDKAAAATAPVPVKREIEVRRPKPAETVALARGGGDLPARRGGRRQPIRSVPQQQAEPAAYLGGKRQASRCGEISRIARLRQLGQNRRQGRALE